ncbi:DNA binding domain-containing protein, excisionase family [Bifidobacterium bohemicum]|uniref:Excisionase domain protein n=1 Tax=Bifidobacterium bohemicum DSM 22767 TaxID=1437606 RepID=A0A086ZE14_9BIFI|nr:helix-turn-helix domain-containing protein [Bifidobacterium bohemicum]KFI44764.1 excisionase domain protein [Bifidobacterium bohemicum DSM 22767]SCC19143.1 DNA binding domain-containing protein, excisionase family [Bifidobacterium bohemicum]
MTKVLETIASDRLEHQDVADAKEALKHMRSDSPLAILLRKAMTDGTSVFIAEKEMSPEKAAEVLGVSRPHVRHLMDKGLIKYDKKGSHFRIAASDLADYVKRHEQAMSEYAQAAATTQEQQDRRISCAASRLTQQQSEEIAAMFAEL